MNGISSHSDAAAGKKSRVTHHDLRTICPFPILYTSCRESLSPTRLGNCQGMLDSSGTKTLPEKRSASDEFATHCVANFLTLSKTVSNRQ